MVRGSDPGSFFEEAVDVACVLEADADEVRGAGVV